MEDLTWLPEIPNWHDALGAARRLPPAEAFRAFQTLASCRTDLVRTEKLDRALSKLRLEHDAGLKAPRVRIALLGSSTLSHLLPGIRIGCLRRGLCADIYEGRFGSYRQELADETSELHRFQPDVLLLALDARHLAAGNSPAEDALATMDACWRAARETLRCAVIQQTVLPCLPSLLGNNEHSLASSPAAVIQEINWRLRKASLEQGVHLLALDQFAAGEGLSFWHDAALWHRAKQEVHPRAAALYGEQVGRIVGALRGNSRKCLVLDLDNTLWGGVIGDDGLASLKLGNGDPAGEAYLAFQSYVRELSRRGVVLAVCSKNDPGNAMLPFDSHPEMLLQRSDIALFVANWDDKASNLRSIAETLSLGLDALVFVDDNPAERALVRRELPTVAVPELPEDPAHYVDCLSRAGYFESLGLTAEDAERTSQYRANARRDELRRTATDLSGFLRDLQMELAWKRVDERDLIRVAQLINKTNQFNLTTRRYVEAQVREFVCDPACLPLQFRLTDVYGNNGIIAVVIARAETEALQIDTWLMSCRVLGRQVEAATLQVLVAQAQLAGATRLIGEYRPTAKNAMVRDHYRNLGFQLVQSCPDGATHWALDVAEYRAEPTHIALREETDGKRHVQSAE